LRGRAVNVASLVLSALMRAVGAAISPRDLSANRILALTNQQVFFNRFGALLV